MKTTINNNKVIIINGVGGSGKDTFVKLCQNHCSKVMNYSSVEFVKKIARECGWEGGKCEKDRKFLSDLKDLLTEYNNIPFKDMDKFIHACRNKVTFLHIREPQEIEKAKKHFNAITLLIQNPNVSLIESNHADRDVRSYNYDYYINNDGTLQDLEYKAIKFMEEEILND